MKLRSLTCMDEISNILYILPCDSSSEPSNVVKVAMALLDSRVWGYVAHQIGRLIFLGKKLGFGVLEIITFQVSLQHLAHLWHTLAFVMLQGPSCSVQFCWHFWWACRVLDNTEGADESIDSEPRKNPCGNPYEQIL